MNKNDRILLDIYKDMEHTLGWSVSGAKDSVRRDGSFVMIPWDQHRFCDALRFVARKFWPRGVAGKKFVDVGAGLGFKIAIADRFGFDATGIEFDKKYVDFAKKYLGWKLVHKDAVTVDYSEYDLIYFYRPISGERQADLEDQIIKTMKSTAVIIGVFNHSLAQKLKSVDDEIFVKKDSPLLKTKTKSNERDFLGRFAVAGGALPPKGWVEEE